MLGLSIYWLVDDFLVSEFSTDDLVFGGGGKSVFSILTGVLFPDNLGLAYLIFYGDENFSKWTFLKFCASGIIWDLLIDVFDYCIFKYNYPVFFFELSFDPPSLELVSNGAT